MAKKSGFFSWFSKDKKEAPETPEQPVVNTESEDVESQLESSAETLISSTTSPISEQREQAEQAEQAELNKQPEVNEPAELNEQAKVTEKSEQSEITETEVIKVSESTVTEELQSDGVSSAEIEPVVAQDLTIESKVASELDEQPEVAPVVDAQPQPQEKPGLFERLKRGLAKTREQIGGGFLSLFAGKQIDDDLYEELETQLLMADVGMDTTMKLIDSLTEHADRKQLKDADALYGLLKKEMTDILATADKPLVLHNDDGPFVILMVGVNGVGKTTTIGKLAKQFQQQGKSVMLAAGDTFRAAAVEQLQVWGERNNVPVVAQHTGADSASVIFDAYQAASARKVDVLIADTAGRLQNKDNLMQELEKIVRVLKKINDKVPHEVMLTIDATTGQNAMSQTKLFNEAVGLTGITLTKLDGSAKGGVIFSVAAQHNIPIRYIGVGEGVDDLRTFEHKTFIDALFD